uniref:Uncharacterized protein n=1 Tax=Avena sativa TaxID=4498 RepID=A0ACD5TYH8_AVESA
MPPRRGCWEQDDSPATGHRGRDEDAPSHAPPSFPVNAAVAYEKKKKKHELVALSDDVLIEILSRVSYRSLCRFKCVSKPWLVLCSSLDIHRRSPRAVSGFFFITNSSSNGLTSHDLTTGGIPLADPTLAFWGGHEHIGIKQCRGGGILFCKCWELCSQEKNSYVVRNTGTEEWIVLPLVEFPDRVDGHRFDLYGADRFLCYDRVNPSRFVVVLPMKNGFGQTREVAIYSSETRRWTSMEKISRVPKLCC